MPRRVVLFVICTAAHFVGAVSAFAWSYSVSSDAFEGRPTGLIGRHVAGPLVDVLWYPLRPILAHAAVYRLEATTALQWLLLAGNSPIWGLTIAAAVIGLAAKISRLRGH